MTPLSEEFAVNLRLAGGRIELDGDEGSLEDAATMQASRLFVACGILSSILHVQLLACRGIMA